MKKICISILILLSTFSQVDASVKQDVNNLRSSPESVGFFGEILTSIFDQVTGKIKNAYLFVIGEDLEDNNIPRWNNDQLVKGAITDDGTDILVDGDIQAERICDENGLNCGDLSEIAFGSIWNRNNVTGEIYYDSSNVGIGTIDPEEKLDVDGDIQLKDELIFKGSVDPENGPDFAFRMNGENLEFVEPEHGNKVWARFVDDQRLELTGTPHLLADGNIAAKGNLVANGVVQAIGNPTEDTHLGNRLYNDGRYVNVGEDVPLTGEITGNTNASVIGDNTIDGANIIDDTITEDDISDSFVARDSDKLGGYLSSQVSGSGTVPVRDINGDIRTRAFRSELDNTTSNIGFIMTQVNTSNNNYIRPSTPAQFRAAVTDDAYVNVGESIPLNGEVTGDSDSNIVADNKIDSANIINNTLTFDDIRDGTIRNQELANNAVNSIKIQDNTVTYNDITDGTIRNQELASNAVNSIKVADNTLTTLDILNDTITESDISDSFKARDSDRLDGYDSGDFLPSTSVVVTGDWNDYKDTGFYRGSGLTNQCPGSSWRYVVIVNHSNTWASQTCNDFNGTGVYQRNLVNGTWGSWRRLLESGDSGDYIEDETIDSSEIQNNTLTTLDVLNNTLTFDDIKDGTIRNQELANNAVNSIKIADNTVTAADLDENSVGASELLNTGNFVMNRLNLSSNSDASMTSGAQGLTIGGVSGSNIAIDGNEILARNNGVGSPLYIQIGADAGNTIMNNDSGNVGIGTGTPTHKFDLRGSMRIDTPSSNYDVWIQGGFATTGEARNLALLGSNTTDQLYLNYGTEYAGGTVIGGNTSITGDLSLTGKLNGDSITENSIDGGEIQNNSLFAIDLGENSVGDSELIDNPTVATPIANGHAANKKYVDDLINGLSWKEPVASSASATYGTCNAAKESWTTFNKSDNIIYVCNGTAWVQISGVAGNLVGDITGAIGNNVIAPNAVTTVKIKDKAVTGSKIENDTITEIQMDNGFVARGAEKVKAGTAYTWIGDLDATPRSMNDKGLSVGFVGSSANNAPISYGTLMNVPSFTAGQDGGAGQILFPYSQGYTGNGNPMFRVGAYNNAGWKEWKTFLDKDWADGMYLRLADSSLSGDVTGPLSNTQIAAGKVGTNELANNAVNSGKIENRSIKGEDLVLGTVTSNELADSVDIDTITGITTLEGNNGNVVTSRDEWLRLNDGNTHENGIYTSGFFRADGGINVGTNEGFYKGGTNVIDTDDNLVVNARLSVGVDPNSIDDVGNVEYNDARYVKESDINSITLGGEITGALNNTVIGSGKVDGDNIKKDSITDFHIDNDSDFSMNKLSLSNQLYVENSSPTLYLVDTDQRSGMIHMNSNVMYFLRGTGTGTTGWTTTNGAWPLTLNMDTNKASFGGDMSVKGDLSITGKLDGGSISNESITGTQIDNLSIKNADIANNAINSSKIENGTILGADIYPNTIGNVEMIDNPTFTNPTVSTPTSNNHAANKKYVDDLINGLSWKEPVASSASATYGTCTAAKESWTTFNKSDNIIYVCNGSAWVEMSSTIGIPDLLGDITGPLRGNSIKNDAVTSAKIAPKTIVAGDIADNTITATQIATDSINNLELSDNAVNTDNIQNKAVTTQKIADGAVTSIKIAEGAVGDDELVDNITVSSITATDGNGILWENGINRITHNDGGGNVQIRFGNDYSTGDTRFTHGGTAFYMGGDLDINDGALKFMVAQNGGAGEDEVVTWGQQLVISENNLTWNGKSVLTAGFSGGDIADRSIEGGKLKLNTVTSAELADDIGVNTIVGINSIDGDFGNMMESSDEWLRLNDSEEHTNGIFTPGLLRADGGLWVSNDASFYDGGANVIDTDDALVVNNRLSIGTDPNSGDDVGDRDYNDARYLSSNTISVTGDWNDHIETGFYRGNALTNQCPGSSWRYVTVMQHSGDRVSQNCNDFNGTGIYQRNKVYGAWGAWRKILESGDIPNATNTTAGIIKITGDIEGTWDEIKLADNSVGNDELIPSPTFTNPIVSTPTANTHAANKAYVDSAVSGVSSTTPNATTTVAGTIKIAGDIKGTWDNIQLKDDSVGNDELIPSPTFTNPIVSTPTASTHAANKAYVDSNATPWSKNGTKLYYNTANVGIGTNDPGEKLEVNGNIKATAFLYSSDERLKENIGVLANPLETVQKLRGVDFNWKSDGKKDIGFIAQEVEQILPDLVKTGKDGMKSVQYGNITAVLVEAMKEQQKMIEQQGEAMKEQQKIIEQQGEAMKLLEQKMESLTK